MGQLESCDETAPDITSGMGLEASRTGTGAGLDGDVVTGFLSQVLLDRLLIEILRVPLHDGQGAGGAAAYARPQSIAETVADDMRLAIAELDGALRAVHDALATAVAQLPVDIDDLASHHVPVFVTWYINDLSRTTA